LLGFSQKLEIGHVPAEIIAKDPGNFFNTITVNKGSSHGIKPDMPVIALQDGFEGLVGKVAGVGLMTSEIIPIYDRNCFVAARLMNTRYEGLTSGQGNYSDFIKMRYVKKNARTEIQYGDLVITSGMNSIYPRGIYLGRIRNIAAKDYETSLELEVEPILDFSKLEYVFILQVESK
ncbi:MAG: rod shape-determining protein MreC, partial [Spirochaetales bacterium]